MRVHVRVHVASAQSKTSQMDRIMTMIRLYRVTFLNEAHNLVHSHVSVMAHN